jgi:protein O-mannosyl-transferase
MPQRKHSRTQRSLSSKTPSPQPSGKTALRNGLAYAVLIVFTLIAYANAWPDYLAFDDRVFADSSRFSGLSPGDVLRFFTEDLWAASGAESSLYRPLLLLVIAAESQIFEGWMAGYHLVNIGLHVLATLLVYGFISQLLQSCGHPRGEARQFALMAAVLFGVHPIHTEAVNSVFNGSEILVTIGVVGGLKWFLGCQDKQPARAWLGLNFVYLLVLFCRESGAALPLLTVAIIWLTGVDSWQHRVRACVPVVSLLLPLGIYLALRSHALGAEAVLQESIAPQPERADQAVPLTRYGMDFGLEKIRPAVSIWFEAWKIQLWPHPLQIYYDFPQTSVWLALAAQVALLASAVVAYVHKRPLFLIGVVFFYSAILPSSRIVGEPGTFSAMADRIVYLPSVGFVIILAVGLRFLAQKFSLNAAVIATLIITAVLMPVTWARNADWSSEVGLFEADYRKLQNKSPILNTLLAAHLRENNYARAVEICDESRKDILAGHSMGVHCGAAYGEVGRFHDAEHTYLAVASSPLGRVFASFNLAMMYAHLGRREEAEEYFSRALAAEKKPFLRKYFEAVAMVQLHPSDRDSLLAARALLEQALELQPQHTESRQELEALNQRLREAPPAR